jgi:hypothetical protein
MVKYFHYHIPDLDIWYDHPVVYHIPDLDIWYDHPVVNQFVVNSNKTNLQTGFKNVFFGVPIERSVLLALPIVRSISNTKLFDDTRL